MVRRTMGEVVHLKKPKPLKRFEVRITLTCYPEARNRSEAKLAALDAIAAEEAIYDDRLTTIRELQEGEA